MHKDMVPHLTTALTGPLLALEAHLLKHQVAIERWLRYQWQATPAPLTGSVDLRNAGFKVAPVDMNLFPAGFNNLNPDFMSLSIQAVQATFEHCHPKCNRILLVPESHTRNQFYLENLAVLQEIIVKSGFEVRIGSLREEMTAPESFDLPSGRRLTLEPLTRVGDKVGVEGFIPCIVWLNNDLSDGVPDILKDLNQTVRPAIELGWYQRLKSSHFAHYQQVCEEFAEIIDIDPWLMNPLFRECSGLDFIERVGTDALIENATSLLQEIQKKYDEYGVKEEPYIVVKADAGTYGMAVMTVRDPQELLTLNRKQRTRMMASKGGHAVDRVILQEGVYSYETFGKDDGVAEPVVYMIGHYVVGGFYRVHKARAADENLNAPGMNFEPLAFVDNCNNPGDEEHNRFYAYGVIARLSLLAAAREKKEAKQ